MALMQIGIQFVSNNNESHYTAYFSPYDIIIDADTELNAIYGIKECITEEAVKRQDFDITLLKDTTENTSPAYIEIDIESEFKKRHSTTIRKNISLPEWLDMRLRKLDADPSKLFQIAAKEFIDKETNKITNLDDLTKYVSKDILDAYVLSRLRK